MIVQPLNRKIKDPVLKKAFPIIVTATINSTYNLIRMNINILCLGKFGKTIEPAVAVEKSRLVLPYSKQFNKNSI